MRKGKVHEDPRPSMKPRMERKMKVSRSPETRRSRSRHSEKALWVEKEPLLRSIRYAREVIELLRADATISPDVAGDLNELIGILRLERGEKAYEAFANFYLGLCDLLIEKLDACPNRQRLWNLIFSLRDSVSELVPEFSKQKLGLFQKRQQRLFDSFDQKSYSHLAEGVLRIVRGLGGSLFSGIGKITDLAHLMKQEWFRHALQRLEPNAARAITFLGCLLLAFGRGAEAFVGGDGGNGIDKDLNQKLVTGQLLSEYFGPVLPAEIRYSSTGPKLTSLVEEIYLPDEKIHFFFNGVPALVHIEKYHQIIERVREVCQKDKALARMLQPKALMIMGENMVSVMMGDRKRKLIITPTHIVNIPAEGKGTASAIDQQTGNTIEVGFHLLSDKKNQGHSSYTFIEKSSGSDGISERSYSYINGRLEKVIENHEDTTAGSSQIITRFTRDQYEEIKPGRGINSGIVDYRMVGDPGFFGGKDVKGFFLKEQNGTNLYVFPIQKIVEPVLTLEEYKNRLGACLDSPKKINAYRKIIFEYRYDIGQTSVTLGTGESVNNYWQTVDETLLRLERGKLLGDCDDQSFFTLEFVKKLGIENAFVVYAPAHVSCIWIDREGGENGSYRAHSICTFGYDSDVGSSPDEALTRVMSKFYGASDVNLLKYTHPDSLEIAEIVSKGINNFIPCDITVFLDANRLEKFRNIDSLELQLKGATLVAKTPIHNQIIGLYAELLEDQPRENYVRKIVSHAREIGDLGRVISGNKRLFMSGDTLAGRTLYDDLFSAGRYPEAREAANNLLGQTFDTYVPLICCLLAEGRVDEARDAFVKALPLETEQVYYAYFVGNLSEVQRTNLALVLDKIPYEIFLRHQEALLKLKTFLPSTQEHPRVFSN